jgi:CheY-like chemotaxis protein
MGITRRGPGGLRGGIQAKPSFLDSLCGRYTGVLVKRPGADASAADTAPHAPARDLAGRRVLMAEDVEQNAEILEDLLSLEDVEAEHAENGEVALRMFREKPAGYYDAILMDVRMPVMDGLSAARAIRDLDRPDAKTIPIIAMTANVFDEDVERYTPGRHEAHLSKPIEPERMYDTLAMHIAAAGEGSPHRDAALL